MYRCRHRQAQAYTFTTLTQMHARTHAQKGAIVDAAYRKRNSLRFACGDEVHPQDCAAVAFEVFEAQYSIGALRRVEQEPVGAGGQRELLRDGVRARDAEVGVGREG
jgi:hypothetical protein